MGCHKLTYHLSSTPRLRCVYSAADGEEDYDGYEQVTESRVTREFVYLPGGAVHVKQGGQSAIYYMHRDHLGSIISITDGGGNKVFAATYDAWGVQTVTNNTFKFHRGYTGHEHLPEFGLFFSGFGMVFVAVMRNLHIKF